jgi:hypothetical protein
VHIAGENSFHVSFALIIDPTEIKLHSFLVSISELLGTYVQSKRTWSTVLSFLCQRWETIMRFVSLKCSTSVSDLEPWEERCLSSQSYGLPSSSAGKTKSKEYLFLYELTVEDNKRSLS